MTNFNIILYIYNIILKMTLYGMHDATGGNQNLDSFKNKDGTQLKTGDIKEFSMPWGFINPFIEKDLLDEGYLTPEGFKQNPDIKKILEILKKNNLEKSKHPSLSKWMTNNTFLETHMLTLKESYNFISMRANDIIYVRGKKKYLNEGWLFKINKPSEILYKLDSNNNYQVFLKFECICKVPEDIYNKINYLPKSFWKITNPEFISEFNKYLI